MLLCKLGLLWAGGCRSGGFSLQSFGKSLGILEKSDFFPSKQRSGVLLYSCPLLICQFSLVGCMKKTINMWVGIDALGSQLSTHASPDDAQHRLLRCTAITVIAPPPVGEQQPLEFLPPGGSVHIHPMWHQVLFFFYVSFFFLDTRSAVPPPAYFYTATPRNPPPQPLPLPQHLPEPPSSPSRNQSFRSRQMRSTRPVDEAGVDLASSPPSIRIDSLLMTALKQSRSLAHRRHELFVGHGAIRNDGAPLVGKSM